MKTIKKFPLVLFVLFALILAACDGATDVDQVVDEVTDAVEEVVEDSSEEVQQAVEEVTEAVEEVVEEVTEEVEEAMDDGESMVQVCEVTDVGGIDDKSFNATAWAGLERAGEDFGIEVKFLESAQQSDYE
ncbi:MAG: BMP family ABC transporter substrate-binding protein, partial [Chloroflexota bacterium]